MPLVVNVVPVGGGHDEREQTLKPLLAEMDVSEGTEGIIVIAATNRSDVQTQPTSSRAFDQIF